MQALKGAKRGRSGSTETDEKEPKKMAIEIAAMPSVTGQGPPSPPKMPPSISLDSDDGNRPKFKFTLDDMHVEFTGKYNRQNKGLKPCDSRELPEPQAEPLSEFQKMFIKIRAKIDAKNANKNK